MTTTRLAPEERRYQRNLTLSKMAHEILNALPAGDRSAFADAAIREKAAKEAA